MLPIRCRRLLQDALGHRRRNPCNFSDMYSRRTASAIQVSSGADVGVAILPRNAWSAAKVFR